MELAQVLLTNLLYILIYSFSTLFIWQFILELSIAFEKHCNCSTSTSRAVATTKIVAKKSNLQISKSNVNLPPRSKQLTVQQLRKKCSQAGIKWSYAIKEPQSGKKRHLNRQEMLIALTQIKQSA
ncbi:hypothetical protein [Iningainema tapete]|uniref:Uncharacterized protein n=1 Tax=Iningainema tapete BLCC-T55 TaxID=2748662 RepID=A0A8J6XHA9_9CYAN|nr:hypothetical protein [Iningainema tapete]MBD2772151.1 hypothetical protein [Iningainema tapete BLCC-T55]